ncbi:transposase IS66 [Cupriavidus basilensis OR16]|uniref:Transposase IS66 n=1 Tax=Cupriavidus basilensis OR16 TaxID=1127483 RepID=H1SAX3_9BURK|nr:transposase IS66 [Cupriavidus basilensis OR16]
MCRNWRLQINQLELRLEDLQAEEAAAAAATAEPKKARKRDAAPGRTPLPEHLEREERVYQPADEACPACGGALKDLGEDVVEQLEFVHAHFRMIRHRRPKKACSCCDCIVQAAAPSCPIDRGIAGPALVAQIAVSKFVDHLPLYRQSVIYARESVELDRSTMASWLGELYALVGPLVNALRRYVLTPGKVHADDTPVPVLAPGSLPCVVATLSLTIAFLCAGNPSAIRCTAFFRLNISFLSNMTNNSPLSPPSYVANQKAPFELTAGRNTLSANFFISFYP